MAIKEIGGLVPRSKPEGRQIRGGSERVKNNKRDEGCLHKKDKRERSVDGLEYIERRFILLVNCFGDIYISTKKLSRHIKQ